MVNRVIAYNFFTGKSHWLRYRASKLTGVESVELLSETMTDEKQDEKGTQKPKTPQTPFGGWRTASSGQHDEQSSMADKGPHAVVSNSDGSQRPADADDLSIPKYGQKTSVTKPESLQAVKSFSDTFGHVQNEPADLPPAPAPANVWDDEPPEQKASDSSAGGAFAFVTTGSAEFIETAPAASQAQEATETGQSPLAPAKAELDPNDPFAWSPEEVPPAPVAEPEPRREFGDGESWMQANTSYEELQSSTLAALEAAKQAEQPAVEENADKQATVNPYTFGKEEEWVAPPMDVEALSAESEETSGPKLEFAFSVPEKDAEPESEATDEPQPASPFDFAAYADDDETAEQQETAGDSPLPQEPVTASAFAAGSIGTPTPETPDTGDVADHTATPSPVIAIEDTPPLAVAPEPEFSVPEALIPEAGESPTPAEPLQVSEEIAPPLAQPVSPAGTSSAKTKFQAYKPAAAPEPEVVPAEFNLSPDEAALLGETPDSQATPQDITAPDGNMDVPAVEDVTADTAAAIVPLAPTPEEDYPVEAAAPEAEPFLPASSFAPEIETPAETAPTATGIEQPLVFAEPEAGHADWSIPEAENTIPQLDVAAEAPIPPTATAWEAEPQPEQPASLDDTAFALPPETGTGDAPAAPVFSIPEPTATEPELPVEPATPQPDMSWQQEQPATAAGQPDWAAPPSPVEPEPVAAYGSIPAETHPAEHTDSPFPTYPAETDAPYDAQPQTDTYPPSTAYDSTDMHAADTATTYSGQDFAAIPPEIDASSAPATISHSPEEVHAILQDHVLWLSSGGKDGRRANFRNANLQQYDLSNSQLAEASFRGANLYGTNFSGCDMRGADLSEAQLGAALFHSSSMVGAVFSRADLRQSVFENSDLQGADFSGAFLGGAVLVGLNLTSTIFLDAYLEGANLAHSSFISANLRGANLSYTNLTGANLSGANCRDVRFDQAILDNAVLEGANLKNASVQGASLLGTDLSSAGDGSSEQRQETLQAEREQLMQEWQRLKEYEAQIQSLQSSIQQREMALQTERMSTERSRRELRAQRETLEMLIANAQEVMQRHRHHDRRLKFYGVFWFMLTILAAVGLMMFISALDTATLSWVEIGMVIAGGALVIWLFIATTIRSIKLSNNLKQLLDVHEQHLPPSDPSGN